MSGAQETVHASCALWGEVGILVRGPSGSGKSTLVRELLRADALLVGDDRVRLRACGGRIVARGHPALEGLIEIRGVGLLRAARTTEAAILRLVVDLGTPAPRLPEAQTARLLDVALPRLAFATGAEAADAVLWRARTIRDMIASRW